MSGREGHNRCLGCAGEASGSFVVAIVGVLLVGARRSVSMPCEKHTEEVKQILGVDEIRFEDATVSNVSAGHAQGHVQQPTEPAAGDAAQNAVAVNCPGPKGVQ